MGRADTHQPVALDDELEAQFARWGVTVASPTAPPPPAAFEIMAQNAASFRVWLAVETQWRVAAGMAGIQWLGLDYGAVDVVLRRLGSSDGDGVFADLLVMEAEALTAFRESER